MSDLTHSQELGIRKQAAEAHRSELSVAFERGEGAAEAKVAELEDRLWACEPRGECPVCGGETDHPDTCEVGHLERRLQRATEALREVERLINEQRADPLLITLILSRVQTTLAALAGEDQT